MILPIPFSEWNQLHSVTTVTSTDRMTLLSLCLFCCHVDIVADWIKLMYHGSMICSVHIATIPLEVQ